MGRVRRQSNKKDSGWFKERWISTIKKYDNTNSKSSVKRNIMSNRELTIILRSVVLGSPEQRTITEAAKMLGIGRPALSFVLNGRADLSIELAYNIERVFKYDALDL